MMKRILCALSAALVLAGMTTGCAGGGGNENGKSPTDADYFSIPAEGEYGDGILLPELKDADVSVMMSIDWAYLESKNDPSDPFQQYYATLIWRNAYDGADVSIVTITEEQMTDFLATQTAAGEAPDILPCNEDTYPTWDSKGLTACIEDYADYIELNKEGMYNLSMMEQLKWAGRYQAAFTLPEPNRSYVVFNKTKFDNCGETDPMTYYQKGTWNWSQFVKTAERMTQGDDYGFTGWGIGSNNGPYAMSKINDDGTAELTIDANYTRYLTEVYNLYHKSKAARAGWDLQNWTSTFPQGTDAMVICDLNAYQRIARQSKKLGGDEFRIAPIPVFDPTGETERIWAANYWAYSISAAARNPIGAAAYIRLETLVLKNIKTALQGKTFLDQNLTEEEKAMIEAVKDEKVLIDPTDGIGNCWTAVIDPFISPKLHFVVDGEETSVQALLDQYKPMLQAEIDEFNQTAQEAAEEQSAAAE